LWAGLLVCLPYTVGAALCEPAQTKRSLPIGHLGTLFCNGIYMLRSSKWHQNMLLPPWIREET